MLQIRNLITNEWQDFCILKSEEDVRCACWAVDKFEGEARVVPVEESEKYKEK